MQYPFERRKYLWNGIQVIDLGGYKKPVFTRLINWRWCSKKISEIHKENPISHIHALWVKESALFANFLRYSLKVPLTVTPMGTELNQKNPFWFLLRKKNIRFVAVSKFHRKYLSTIYGKTNPDLIPWGIQPSSIEIPKFKRMDILFVGYLNKTKNFGLFLDVVKEVSAAIQVLKVGVVGDYFGLNEFEEQAEQKKISKNITFYGLIPNEQVIELMRESKILLHTSDFETQGYAMLEALANGMYIVSRQVGIAEASERWKIAKDKDEFVSLVLRLLKDYEPLPEGQVPYTLEETCRKYLEIYSA
jgi:glycosyltransferase involved in cell wall biosynthesis